MSATQVLERFGLWVLLRFLVVLTVFTTLALVRLPILWLAAALTWAMHHTDRLMTTPPASQQRPAGGSAMPDTNTGRSQRPAWTGPAAPPSTSDIAHHETPTGDSEPRHETSHTASRDASRHTGTTRRVASWIAWHSLELSAVTVPLALAVWVATWFLIPAALVGLLWATHEIRLAHHNRAITTP